MDLELINALRADEELIAHYKSAIREVQHARAKSLELIAENSELLKLIEQINSPLIAPPLQKSPAPD